MHKDLFLGVIVKEWAIVNQKRINVHSYNEALFKSCVEYYHECWKLRCAVLHDIEVQKKVLKEEALEIT